MTERIRVQAIQQEGPLLLTRTVSASGLSGTASIALTLRNLGAGGAFLSHLVFARHNESFRIEAGEMIKGGEFRHVIDTRDLNVFKALAREELMSGYFDTNEAVFNLSIHTITEAGPQVLTLRIAWGFEYSGGNGFYLPDIPQA